MDNTKWYASPETDATPVVSARIRLARNVQRYCFPDRLKTEDATTMMNDVALAVANASPQGNQFELLFLNNCAPLDKRVMLERHLLSKELFESNRNTGLLKHAGEGLCVMLNEEDHIRIQSIMPGGAIDEAFDMANQLDDAIEQSVEYAFQRDFGYLTACPTNTGTGLRASFMVHLPMLERSGHLKNIIPALSKFGMTVRGIYGEGTEPVGGMYQISNQLTLGKSETEIIEALKNVTRQIIEQETQLMTTAMNRDKWGLEDSVHRSLGVLLHCRKISSKEAMVLLSNLRLGILTGVIEQKPEKSIYSIMMGIQPGALAKAYDMAMDEQQRDICRASVIRECLKNMQ